MRRPLAVDPDDKALRRRPTWMIPVAVCVLVALPLVVAVIALRRPTWVPILDLAITELRVRDVGTGHTPLIGLPGRIGPLSQQGSHPGPASFYALAPAYRLFGGTSWALQIATVTVHLAAGGTALFLARRRGGTTLVAVVGAILAVLMVGYGPDTLLEPWNPYLPVLWWFALLLATWSVLCGDVRVLPVAGLAASFAAQTHIPYAANAVAMGGLATAAVVWAVIGSARGSPARHSAQRAILVTAIVVTAVWTPPVIDEIRNDPGNLTQIWRHFSDPPEEAAGTAKGVELLLVHLDPVRMVTEQRSAADSLADTTASPSGAPVVGAIVFALWAVSAVYSRRLGNRALSVLHLTVGVASVVGALSLGRIFGILWFYLMLWASGIACLMYLAIGATVYVACRARGRSLDRTARRGALVVLAAASLALSAQTATAEPPAPIQSERVAALVGPTATALHTGVGAASGDRGTYRVTWSDVAYIGAEGYALLNELDRRGFDVGAPFSARVPATWHRVVEPADATALVHIANGVHVARWRATAGAVEVAFHDRRTPADVREFAAVRAEVIAGLERSGHGDLVVGVDENLFATAIDARVPAALKGRMTRMLELGFPTAVFIAPPGAEGRVGAG